MQTRPVYIMHARDRIKCSLASSIARRVCNRVLSVDAER